MKLEPARQDKYMQAFLPRSNRTQSHAQRVPIGEPRQVGAKHERLHLQHRIETTRMLLESSASRQTAVRKQVMDCAVHAAHEEVLERCHGLVPESLQRLSGGGHDTLGRSRVQGRHLIVQGSQGSEGRRHRVLGGHGAFVTVHNLV